jgi:hypothetical protein
MSIAGAGMTPEGLPFVQMSTGLRFFGPAKRAGGSATGQVEALLADLKAAADVKCCHRHLCQPGETVIDIGAGAGYAAMAIAGQVGQGGQVLAVEDRDELLTVLGHNLQGNFPDVTTVLPRRVDGPARSRLVASGAGGLHAGSLDPPSDPPHPTEADEQADSLAGLLDSAGLNHVDLLVLRAGGRVLSVLDGADGCWARVDQWAIDAKAFDGDASAIGAVVDRLTAAGLATEVASGWIHAKRWPDSHRSGSGPLPVFIGGCSRSGTTLLRVLLDGHPNIACGPEADLLCRPMSLQPGDLAYKFDMELEDVVRLADQSAFLPDFACQFLSRYAHNRDKARWAEKTPRNVQALGYLFDNFPEARFIHVVRDGRDVVCSLRTHPRHVERNGQWVPNTEVKPLDRCIDRWVQDVSRGLAWADDPRCHLVRYEDLVAEPAATMCRLLEFLGEPWDDAVLQPPDRQEGSTDTMKFPQNRRAVQPIDRQSVGRWKTDLTDDELGQFNARAGELMARLGY